MKISLIVPVFNEEETIPIFYKTIREYTELKRYEVEIIFINDGSKDTTESLIYGLEETDSNVKAISFMRNFGKEAALMAGLNAATGDAMIPIDVDLQDPVEVIPQLIMEWINGSDVVLAKRIDRSSDGFLKRKTAEWFYRIYNKLNDVHIEENVGDFRLLSKDVVNHIIGLSERNLFMKGLLSWVGGKVSVVEYTRAKRVAGTTKFNGWKLWNLALEGITSFSTALLKIWTYIGMILALFAIGFGIWMAIDKVLFGNPVPGYPSLLVSILFIGGVQLIGIGILGEYIGRIYIETKKRPRYIIKSKK